MPQQGKMGMVVILLLGMAHAELPLASYPGCGTVDRLDLCPSDFYGEWSLLSYVPAEARSRVREAELALGSGIHADSAWSHTTGQWDTILAVGDSGVEWHDLSIVRKFHLNVLELPVPTDAKGVPCPASDCDGNGLSNITDWEDDLRVDPAAGHDSADHLLDPSDLIAIFSDGIDDDANGYTDDICGWDFFGADNDPTSDRTDEYGTHATGVMRVAAAEGGDEHWGIGVCPNCAILPVRLSDTILSDGVRVAQGIGFATDHGAAAISLAHGALSNAQLTEQVIRYAWDQGTLVLGVSGDFNSYHNFYPAMSNGALYLRSSRSNTGDEDTAYSYFNSWNCNNFGPRLDLIAPENACATGAAAITLGATGLIVSAAHERGLTLSSGEVRQLLTMTADDVWLTESEQVLAASYPSSEGFDAFTGYGRLNVGAAVSAVVSGDIPPVAALWSPSWFDSFDLSNTSTVEVRGQVSAVRSEGYTWTLSWGQGESPTEWESVETGSGVDPFEGVLSTVDIAQLVGPAPRGPSAGETLLARMERAYEPAVTWSLHVVDASGLEAESRVTVFVQQDGDLLPGFPMDLSSSLESSPVLADLEGNGVYAIVVATGEGEVWALNGQGEPLPGWPVITDRHPNAHDDAQSVRGGGLPIGLADGSLTSPAVGDLDGDGSNDVVVTTLTGAVYAWDAQGSILQGFPYRIWGRTSDEIDDDHLWENSIWSAPVLYDLDDDGTLEIGFTAMDGRLYVLDHQGQDWGPYPVEICAPETCGVRGDRSVTTPAVGDVDGDGDPDWAVGTSETWSGGSRAYLYDARTAELHSGWPVESFGLISNEALFLPILGEGHPASLSLVDLDQDGDLELANSGFLTQEGLIHHDGTIALDVPYVNGDGQYGPRSNVYEPGFSQVASSPTLGDVDGDGVPDLIVGATGMTWLVGLSMNTYVDYQHVVGGWSGATGAFLEGFPRQIEDWTPFTSAAVADLDDDGLAEVIHGSAGYFLHAWSATGDSPKGWPKFTGHWLLASPAVGDVNGDGYLDVVVGSREGFLWVWSTKGRADQRGEWTSSRHDPHNTGNYETPLSVQKGPRERKEEATGCGCTNNLLPNNLYIVSPMVILALAGRRRGRKTCPEDVM
jgi:hypothetical protein